jgi:rhodanese-related sulfurtransferase
MALTALDLVQQAKQQITEVSTEEAQSMLEAGAILIDVREKMEFDTGHIPGALHLSRGMLEFQVASKPELKDKTVNIVVYCKSGGRSALATATLNKMGYINAKSMMGGFDAWSAGMFIPPETQA